ALLLLSFSFSLSAQIPVAAPGETAEVQQRIAGIHKKQQSGQPLSAEDRQFIQHVNQARMAAWAKEHPPHDSVGLIPLTDLGAGLYKGEQGGLYPGGVNTPPPAYEKAGLAMAREIVPRDAAGNPAPDGKIVLISCGMSNTTMKFQAFQKLAAAEGGLNPHLVLVDGAQGGQVARITANPDAHYWIVDDQRLEAAGVTRNQVQAAWMEQANPGPTRPFPAEVKDLQRDILATLHVMHDRFPNLKIVYLSSRTYAGYASTPLNPEPHAYETGFAVKWLIADRIAQDGASAPWIAWGPYLWADGVKARNDGLSYDRADYGPDGTHPSLSGREKVAKLLLHFLKTDPTSRPWFSAQ
ncbi:MAG: hypothetical protein ABI165_19160, partial [Bryobacteraceae bacterium]